MSKGIEIRHFHGHLPKAGADSENGTDRNNKKKPNDSQSVISLQGYFEKFSPQGRKVIWSTFRTLGFTEHETTQILEEVPLALLDWNNDHKITAEEISRFFDHPDVELYAQKALRAADIVQKRRIDEQLEQFDALWNAGRRAEAEKLFTAADAIADERSGAHSRMPYDDPSYGQRTLSIDAGLKYRKALLLEAKAKKPEQVQEAARVYDVAQTCADLALEKDPKDVGTYLLRSQIKHARSDYLGALGDLDSAITATPEGPSREGIVLKRGFYLDELRGFKNDVASKRKAAANAAVKNPIELNKFLFQEINLAEALLSAAGPSEKTSMTGELAALKNEQSASFLGIVRDEYLDQVQKVAVQAELTGEDVPKEWWTRDLIKIGGDHRLSPTPEFYSYSMERQVEVLQAVQKISLIKNYRKLEAIAADPQKKLYYQAQVLMLEDRIPEARLKMQDFHDQIKARETKKVAGDPELGEMDSQVKAVLKGFSLHSLHELGNYNEMLVAQHQGIDKAKFLADRAETSQFLIDYLTAQIESDRATTLDEALDCLQQDQAKLRKDWLEHPIVKAHWTVFAAKLYGLVDFGSPEFNRNSILRNEYYDAFKKDPHAVHPEIPTIAVEGTFVIHPSEKLRPMRIVIPATGGELQVDASHYTFPKSDHDRILFFFGGIAGELIPQPGLQEGVDYQKHIGSIDTTGMNTGKRAWHAGHPQALDGLLDSSTGWKTDESFKLLVERESRAGLEAAKTVEAARARDLKVAMTLRENGDLVAAAEMFHTLFEKELEAAKLILPQEVRDKVAYKAEETRPKIEQDIRDHLEKEHVIATEEQIREAVDRAVKMQIDEQLKKETYPNIEDYMGADAIGGQAWKQFNDMMDPNDEAWNLADQTWDIIKEEAAVMAVTLPLTMGVGSVIRAGLTGAEWILRLANIGRLARFGVRAGIFITASATEGLTQEAIASALTQQPFEWKNVGLNIVTNMAFHGGNSAWRKIATKIGIAEKSILDIAGMMALQTEMSAVNSYLMDLITGAENPKGFWSFDRQLGEAARQFGYHFGTWGFNKATRNFAAHAENRSRLKAEIVQKEMQRLKPQIEAGKLSHRHALDLAVQRAQEKIPSVFSGQDPKKLVADLQEAMQDTRPPEVPEVVPIPAVEQVPPGPKPPPAIDSHTADALPDFARRTTQRSYLAFPKLLRLFHLNILLTKTQASGNEFGSLAIEVDGKLVTDRENYLTSHSPKQVEGKDLYSLFQQAASDLDTEEGISKAGTLRIYSFHTHPTREGASTFIRSANATHEDGHPYTLTNDGDWNSYKSLFKVYVQHLRNSGWTGPIEMVAGAMPAQNPTTAAQLDPALAKEPYIATTTLRVEAGQLYEVK